MIRRVARAAMVALLTFLAAVPAAAAPLSFPPRPQDGFPDPGPPTPVAPSWILYDASTDMVLAASGADEERAIASVTKIMTALVALERADLNEVVTISARAAATGEKEIGLVEGEQVTMGALLKALLVASANDAATAIAEHVGGSVEAFVDLMNRKAEELGLNETHFANPHGLDSPRHYSSASDLVVLAMVAMEFPQFRDAVRAQILVFPDDPEGNRRVATTTNLLLNSYRGLIGVKTGFTSQAQLTFVAAAERQGRTLYAVVLGSEGNSAHFEDAKGLLDYGFGEKGMLWTLLDGALYLGAVEPAGPDPLTVQAGVEALVAVTAPELTQQPPASEQVEEEPRTVEPVTVVSRLAGSGPDSILEAFRFWFLDLVGG
ncbi:MAG: D-alanyl-D-alanine carboxypeptidase family protein [Acidimicrobiia bacterium]